MSDPCDASLLSISECDLGRLDPDPLTAEPQPTAAQAWSPRPEDDAAEPKSEKAAGRPWGLPSVGLPWKPSGASKATSEAGGPLVETTAVTEVSQLHDAAELHDDGVSSLEVPVTPIGIGGSGARSARAAAAAMQSAAGGGLDTSGMCMPGALPSPKGSEAGGLLLPGGAGPGGAGPGSARGQRPGSAFGGPSPRSLAAGGPPGSAGAEPGGAPPGPPGAPTCGLGCEVPEATPVSAFEAPEGTP